MGPRCSSFRWASAHCDLDRLHAESFGWRNDVIKLKFSGSSVAAMAWSALFWHRVLGHAWPKTLKLVLMVNPLCNVASKAFTGGGFASGSGAHSGGSFVWRKSLLSGSAATGVLPCTYTMSRSSYAHKCAYQRPIIPFCDCLNNQDKFRWSVCTIVLLRVR